MRVADTIGTESTTPSSLSKLAVRKLMASKKKEIEVDGRSLIVSNLDKVFFPETGFTKGEVIAFYSEIADAILPHLRDRPLTLKRYPDGIEGKRIPLISRIIAVADAYNAMTSDRPYRDAMPSRVARMRLAQGIEGQFDTDVVAAFEAILAGAGEDYRTATRLDFTLEAQDSYSDGVSERAA
jgi:hypothetical protein